MERTETQEGTVTSADKWISTIVIFVKPRINEKSIKRQLLQVWDMI
jgi:hypothetical protein